MTGESNKPRDWATQPPLIHADDKSTRPRGPTKPLIPLLSSLSEIALPVDGHDNVDPIGRITRHAC